MFGLPLIFPFGDDVPKIFTNKRKKKEIKNTANKKKQEQQ